MSALKRRDNRNRILQRGESQRPDGRYTYKYVDALGKTKYVYAWKLLPTDRTPKGKRDDLSLREKERIIQRDLYDGIDTQGGKMTLCQLYAKKNAQRPNVTKNTEVGRKYLMKALEDDILGSRSIDTIKPSDAREWATRMQQKGFSFGTIKNYKRSLKASFCMAIDDDYVNRIWRKNPECQEQYDQTAVEPMLLNLRSVLAYRQKGERLRPAGGAKEIMEAGDKWLIEPEKIKVPVLIVTGDIDFYVNTERCYEAVRKLPKGSAIGHLEHAGHAMYLEKNFYQKTRQAILNFLGET